MKPRPDILARIANLEREIVLAKSKRHRIDEAITTRLNAINRLRCLLGESKGAASPLKHEQPRDF